MGGESEREREKKKEKNEKMGGNGERGEEGMIRIHHHTSSSSSPPSPPLASFFSHRCVPKCQTGICIKVFNNAWRETCWREIRLQLNRTCSFKRVKKKLQDWLKTAVAKKPVCHYGCWCLCLLLATRRTLLVEKNLSCWCCFCWLPCSPAPLLSRPFSPTTTTIITVVVVVVLSKHRFLKGASKEMRGRHSEACKGTTK